MSSICEHLRQRLRERNLTAAPAVLNLVAVVLHPPAHDVRQFLKSGIMEIPDVPVVTKADLGVAALRSWHDLIAALRALGGRRAATKQLAAQDGALDVPALTRALEAAAR